MMLKILMDLTSEINSVVDCTIQSSGGSHVLIANFERAQRGHPDLAGPYGCRDKSCATVRTSASRGAWRDSVSARGRGSVLFRSLISHRADSSAEYRG